MTLIFHEGHPCTSPYIHSRVRFKLIYKLLTIVILINVQVLNNSLARNPNSLARPAVDSKVLSPDNKYSVWLEETSQSSFQGKIQKLDDKNNVSKFDLPTTVSALYWTGNSQTIISVILLAGGPKPFLTHLNSRGKWICGEVNLPSVGLLQKESLVNCMPGYNTIKVEYVVQPDYRFLTNYNQFFLVSGEIEPQLGIFTNITWQEIQSEEAYKLIKNFAIF